MKGFLRSCPRCGGDVFAEYDPFAGPLLVCLQCGHLLTHAEEEALRARAAPRRSAAA